MPRRPPTQDDLAIFFGAFGDEGSTAREHSNAVFDEIVSPVARDHALLAKRVDREAAPGNLTSQTFDLLHSARVAVCDVTGASPNVFYELGVIHACNIPVVLLSETPHDLPFYVSGERIIVTGVRGSSTFSASAEQLSRALTVALSPTYAPASEAGRAFASPFPPSIGQAMRRVSSPLYRRRMEYDLRVREVDTANLLMRLSVSYLLVNGTREFQTQTVGIVPMRPFEPVFGRIAERDLDIDDPDHFTERGWRVEQRIEPQTTTEVIFVADVRYRMPDADIFATYLPATDFRLTIRYPHSSVRLVTESLLDRTVTPETVAPGVLVYEPRGALLAHQGFRLDWLSPRRTRW